MADYIDRQAAIAALREFAEDCKGSDEAATAAAMAISVISRLPSSWISTGDMLPERNGYYLCLSRFKLFDGTLDKNIRTYLRYYSATAKTFEGQRLSLITHWMPLPDAPEVGK